MTSLTTIEIKNYFNFFDDVSKASRQNIFLSFIESGLVAIYYFLSLYFVNILKMDISIAGIIISCYGLGTIFGGFIGGKLSDKIPPSKVLAVSLLMQACAFLVLIQIKTPLFIALDLFILGIATYSFITSNYVEALSHCKDSEAGKLKVINFLCMGSNLGIGIAAFLIGELADTNFVYIFYLSGIMLFILSISVLFKQKNLSINDKAFSQNITTTARRNTLDRGLFFALVCLFFTGMVVSQISTTYSIYLKENFPSIGLHAFSLFFSLNTFLIVFFQNYVVNKFKEKNKTLMIGVGSALICFGMFLLNFTTGLVSILSACLIYSLGEMIFFSITQLYCYEKAGENNKGSGLGIYRMVYATSRFIGPSIGGGIYAYLGGNIVWYLSGLIGGVFLLWSNFLKD